MYNMKTMAVSLRQQGLRAKASRRLSPVSYREHGQPVSENLLEAGLLRQRPESEMGG